MGYNLLNALFFSILYFLIYYKYHNFAAAKPNVF